jgi:hypothetical protein
MGPGVGALKNPAGEEILTREECAAWLKVRPRELTRLGVPCVPLSKKLVRYIRADVTAWLESKRTGKR